MRDSLRIAVVSDTHRWTKDVISHLQDHPCDELIFLGDNSIDGDDIAEALDMPGVILTGNCDWQDARESEVLVHRQGYSIFCTHGHKYLVKETLLPLGYRAKEVGADIVLFGHTHSRCHLQENGIHYLNPGSPSMPNPGEEAGYAVLTLGSAGITVDFILL